MNIKNFALLLALAGAAFAPVAQAAPQSQQTAKQSAPAVKRAQGVWIDVRTPEEYQAGHLDGAINIPYEQIGDKIAQVSPNKNAPVNLYCRTGRRAEVALQALKKLGYTHVTNHGGYQDLLNKGIR